MRSGVPFSLHFPNSSSAAVCGATLLSVVASGSALIAELLRLGQAIPAVFLDPAERAKRGNGDVSAEEAAFERVAASPRRRRARTRDRAARECRRR